MSDHSKVDDVASGAPYQVVAVDGSPASGVRDIPEADVVVIHVRHGQQHVTIHGAVHHADGIAIVHEKTHDGTGKDVRTWEIRPRGSGFDASERSLF